MKLTPQQKLDALSHRFYSNGQWEPKAGDHYTTSRADLELYQVVSVDENVVRTRYTEGSDTIAEWPAAGFLTEGFGPKRVFVPEWILSQPPKEYLIGDVTSEKVFRAAGLANLSDLQAVFDAVEKALTTAPQNNTEGDLDDKTIVKLAREHFSSKDYDQLTYEKSVPLFPQATYDVPRLSLSDFVKAVRSAPPSPRDSA